MRQVAEAYVRLVLAVGRHDPAYVDASSNYNLGQDLVRDSIEARGGTAANAGRRWDLFLALLHR